MAEQAIDSNSWEERQRLDRIVSIDPMHYGGLKHILEIRKNATKLLRQSLTEEGVKVCSETIDFCDDQIKIILAVK